MPYLPMKLRLQVPHLRAFHAAGERHHHYGQALLDHLLEYARSHKARFVRLEVRSSNEAAIGLYERSGFKRVGVRPEYYERSGEDAVVMLFDLGGTGRVQRAAGRDA